MSIATLESEGLTPSTRTAELREPTRMTLWEVDGNGIAVGKPVITGTKEECHEQYGAEVKLGCNPKYLRITEAGKRPDGLGYRG
jgi:hypothetical protein